MKKKKYKFIDLFAGLGGFLQAGNFEELAHVEWEIYIKDLIKRANK